jgi:hypothetical protein
MIPTPLGGWDLQSIVSRVFPPQKAPPFLRAVSFGISDVSHDFGDGLSKYYIIPGSRGMITTSLRIEIVDRSSIDCLQF